MKLWHKGTDPDKRIEEFTTGKDRELDLVLAPYDILGTLAHIAMLTKAGLLPEEDHALLRPELIHLYHKAVNNQLVIEQGVEDIHSQVELMLTRQLGDTGKKVHSGRSRNDQVLLDMKLFLRARIKDTVASVNGLFDTLIGLSNRYADVLMPGYTHMQIAMPSSFGLWLGAYAESLTDDLIVLQAAYRIANQNPLGSAAGYGSSFPLDRQMTTDLLGFEQLNVNSVYAQMGRGKTEKITGFALSSIASTLARLSMDICLYMGQNFGFLTFPDQLTTGSSIMPHKKNPDVFEIIRAQCNLLQGLPQSVGLITGNLPSGYHRDLQVTKELIVPAFDQLTECMGMMAFMLEHMRVNPCILDNPIYDYLFSVEAVNREVLQGVPFRDAYKKIGQQIAEGKFTPDKNIRHTHIGSIGNLCNESVSAKMHEVVNGFRFSIVEDAVNRLIS